MAADEMELSGPYLTSSRCWQGEKRHVRSPLNSRGSVTEFKSGLVFIFMGVGLSLSGCVTEFLLPPLGTGYLQRGREDKWYMGAGGMVLSGDHQYLLLKPRLCS